MRKKEVLRFFSSLVVLLILIGMVFASTTTAFSTELPADENTLIEDSEVTGIEGSSQDIELSQPVKDVIDSIISSNDSQIILGSMSIQTHEIGESTKVAYIADHFPVEAGQVLHLNSLNEELLYCFAVFDSNTIGDGMAATFQSGWTRDDTFVSKNGYGVIMLATSTDEDSRAVMDPTAVSASFYLYSSYNEYLTTCGYGAVNTESDINYRFWDLGTFSTDTGEASDSSVRIRVTNDLFYKDEVSTPDFIECDDDMAVCLWFFDSNGQYIIADDYGKLGNTGYMDNVDILEEFLKRPTAAYFKITASHKPKRDIVQSYQTFIHFYKRDNRNNTSTLDIYSKYPGLTDLLAAGKSAGGGNNAQNITFDLINYTQNLTCVMHLTDVHGDRIRFNNACKIINTLGNRIGDPVIVNTGDDVACDSNDPLPYDGTPPFDRYLFAVGNHDAYQFDEAQVHSKFIAPLADKYGYAMPNGIENPNYYYYDYEIGKIRFIAIDDYQYNGSVPKTPATIVRCYHQEQIDWFCNVLLTTPEGYGVVILRHGADDESVSDGYNNTFCNDSSRVSGTKSSYCPIRDIVDAWISGTSINKSYSQSGTYLTSDYANVTAKADFATKAANTEFICYMSGHFHSDFIGYCANSTNRQTVLRSICTNAWYHRSWNLRYSDNYPHFNEDNDMSRIEGTPTENAINFYVIDRDKKIIKVVRVGARMTYNFTPREHMIISYEQPSKKH